jgi:hypothetical protein
MNGQSDVEGRGSQGEPVFAVNGTLTPTEATTWSEVKTLFN